MYIRNKEDLKFAYGFMKLAELHGLDSVRDEVKADIRKYLRKPEKEGKVIKEYGIDGFISLSPLPEFLKTKEDANEWFNDNEYLRCMPSPYDCTGQAFTNWYKIFKRGDRFWVYHSISFDV